MDYSRAIAVLAFAIVWLLAAPVCAKEPVFSASSYKIKVFVFAEPSMLPASGQKYFAETVLDRCRLLFGTLYELRLEFPDRETPEMLKARFVGPPPAWDALDKIFVAEFTDTQGLRLIEFDVKARFTTREGFYELENPAKAVDVFLAALFAQISPLAKMDKASSETASFQIKGADIAAALRKSDLSEVSSLAGVDINRSVLLPFIRSMDRNGKLTGIAPVPWTVLVPEKIDPITNRLHCRIESALRSSLAARRRGQTEVYALVVPTPMLPTTLKLQARTESNAAQTGMLQTLPVYEVFEAVPGVKKPISIGQTQTDGTFILEPNENRVVRTLLIRGGRTLIAKIPVGRGLEPELRVPIPDDSVRLEAEGVILGIQEEMIDVAALRSIFRKRLEKYEKENDKSKIQETEGLIHRLKSADRFLIELEQAQLRFQSTDPVVQRRIDKLFRETRRAIQGL